jgi:hypothetical protein
VIPLEVATAPSDVQQALAKEITDLQLARYLDELGGLTPTEVRDLVVEKVGELGRLTAPFGRDSEGRRRVGGAPGTEVLVDLADFLRRFPGDPALLGDICLVQADVRVSAVVLQPLLDRDPIAYHSETDWISRVAAGLEEGGAEFELAEEGIRRFHAEVAEAGRRLLAEDRSGHPDDPDQEETDRQLRDLIEICDARVAAFDREGHDRGRYLPPIDTPRITLVRGVPVRVDLLVGLGRVARSVWGLFGRRPVEAESPEDEPRQRPMH